MSGNNEPYEISPSDIAQAKVRAFIIGVVVLWSYYLTGPAPIDVAFTDLLFSSSIVYFWFAVLFYFWSVRVERSKDNVIEINIKRSSGLIVDLCGIAYYTAIAGEHGFLLYPAFLTVIIGNGYRFGLHYLYASVIVALISYTVALKFNPALLEPVTLRFAYYLGLIVVPLYAAALLRRHSNALERLNEVNKSRSRFIANMSHEFRTPLHGIISSADLMAETRKDGIRDPRLTLITEAAMHLLGLVNRVLDVASANAGIVLIEDLNSVNIRKALRTSINICKARAEEKSLEIDWYISPDVPRSFASSEQHLQEILVNTIGNAVKYTESGQVFVAASLEENLDHLLIEIHDTGIGINANDLQTIFEPFALGDDTAVRKHGGTGLGLTITQHYVEQLGGEVKIKSEVGNGTQCFIRLPLANVEAPEISDSTEKPKFLLLTSRKKLRADESLAAKDFDVSVSIIDPQFSAGSGLDFSKFDIILLDVALDNEFSNVYNVVSLLTKGSEIIMYCPDEFSKVQRIGRNVPYKTLIRYGNAKDYSKAIDVIGYATNEAQELSESSVNKYKILAADDNRTNLQTLVMALGPIGHEIITVTNGEDALDELQSEKYDLALLDMHMPGISGADIAKMYKFGGTANPTPIILLTADVTKDTREEAEDAEVDLLLTKPVRPKELRSAVQKTARAHASSVGGGGRIANEKQLIDAAPLTELHDLGVSDLELINLIQEFSEDSSEILELTRQCLRTGKYGTARDHMHSLKGAALTVGAIEVSRRASKLEKQPIREFGEKAEAELTTIGKVLEQSTAALKVVVNTDDPTEKPSGNIVSFIKDYRNG